MKKWITKTNVFAGTTKNSNNIKTTKYSSKVEAKSFATNQFRVECDFHRLQNVKKDTHIRKKHAKKKDIGFSKTLRDPLNVGDLFMGDSMLKDIQGWDITKKLENKH